MHEMLIESTVFGKNMKSVFSASADRNKAPILRVLESELAPDSKILEIGSGTGQHACYFAKQFPDVTWQPTELEANISHIKDWIAQQGNANILDPLVLDVAHHPWPAFQANVCYTCNTFHIMGIESVHSVFKGCKTVLHDGGKLIVYGPFAIQGKHTSASNQQFDLHLRNQNPLSGIRDLSSLDTTAQQHGFNACRTIEMPSNNLCVIWTIDS